MSSFQAATDFQAATPLIPGVDNPALLTQSVFRLALSALSEPARPLAAEGAGLPKAAPLPPLVAALALTLLDQGAPVWLSPSFAGAAQWLRFHTGAPVAQDPARAHFILAASPGEMPPLGSLAQGTARYPDRSATVILSGVLTGEGAPLAAEGPGISGRRRFAGHGLSEKFLAKWQDNRAAYPLGVDLFLAGEKDLAGLSRTTNLRLWTTEDEACM